MTASRKNIATVRRYRIDLNKLFNEMDSKRRRHRLSWARVASRIGVSESALLSLGQEKRQHRAERLYRSLDADIFVGIMQFLKQPYERYVIDNRTDKYLNDVNYEEVESE